MDTFYVTDLTGDKISSESRMDRVRTALLEAIAAGEPELVAAEEAPVFWSGGLLFLGLGRIGIEHQHRAFGNFAAVVLGDDIFGHGGKIAAAAEIAQAGAGALRIDIGGRQASKQIADMYGAEIDAEAGAARWVGDGGMHLRTRKA